MIRPAMLALLVAAHGCGPKDAPPLNSPDANAPGAAMTALVSSVGVEVRPDTVRLVLHVTNPTNQPVTLEFNSGQRYDFAIRTAAGTDVWTWSADKLFAQMVGTEVIAPGASLDYAETWAPGSQKGSFVVVARLASTSHPISEQTAFQIQ